MKKYILHPKNSITTCGGHIIKDIKDNTTEFTSKKHGFIARNFMN